MSYKELFKGLPIECKISTPQFKGYEIYQMKDQDGIFYVNTLFFLAADKLNGHNVQFHSLKSFKKSLLFVANKTK